MNDVSIRPAAPLPLSAALDQKDRTWMPTCTSSANSKRALWGFGGAISAVIGLTTASTIEELWGKHLVDCAQPMTSELVRLYCLFDDAYILYRALPAVVGLAAAVFCTYKAVGTGVNASSASKSSDAAIASPPVPLAPVPLAFVPPASEEEKLEKVPSLEGGETASPALAPAAEDPTKAAKKEEEAKTHAKTQVNRAPARKARRGRASSRQHQGQGKQI